MNTKDSDYNEKLISSLERTINSLDTEYAKIEDELNSIKLSRSFRLSTTRITPINYTLRPFMKLARMSKHLAYISQLKRGFHNVLREYYNINPNSSAGTVEIGIVMRDGDVRPQSSGFIRLISPLSYGANNKKISMQFFNGDISGSTARQKRLSVFIVQRTAFSSTKTASIFLDNIRRNKSKLIIDLDDAFSLLSKNHPQYHLQKPGVSAMELLIRNADELWCSTREIAKLYEDKTKVRVLPNSIDSRVWNPNLETNKPRKTKKVQLVYMGTQTHADDLKIIISALDRMNAIHPNLFELTVIGIARNVPLRDYIKHSPYIRSQDTIYPRFVQWFQRQGPFDIGLSPLVSNSFNDAKSDIKCMDYLALGIIPVVSNTKPYNTSDLAPFVITVDNSPIDWAETLSSLVSDPHNLSKARSVAEQGRQYVFKNRNVSSIADALLE